MRCRVLQVCALLCLLESMLCGAEPTTFDLSRSWDATIPLANPHKGWYHHYYDNALTKYLTERDEDLLEFPGMDHIYLRLAWSYLEPQEGEFRWEIIDRVIKKWTERGLRVSLRITCKETGTQPIEQQFATPRWVMEAGAKGGHFRRYHEPGDPRWPWEPVYDDPVFLEKLDNFIRALAERYDGRPWLSYVDIGSLGDWGEGHTGSGSQIKYDCATKLKHLEIHTRYFKKTQLMISDDFVRETPTEEGQAKLHRYIVDHGISYRDDSILTDFKTQRYSKTFSVSNPEYYEAVYRTTPTVLEMQHLRIYTAEGKWAGREGTALGDLGATGADFLRGAVELIRATYIGYHGPADQWMALPDNPALTVELLNRCGYWYFPHAVTIPVAAGSGGDTITVTWENRGVAPAYHPYKIIFRLRGKENHSLSADSGNLNWTPDQPNAIYTETYRMASLATLAPGRYDLAMKLYCPSTRRDVLLPLQPELRDGKGFYRIGSFDVR